MNTLTCAYLEDVNMDTGEVQFRRIYGTKEAYTTYVYVHKDSLVNAIIEDNGAKVLALALGQFVRGREISNPVTPPKLC